MPSIELEGRETQSEPEPADGLSEEQLRRNGILCCIAGFMANFVVFGIGFTFGVFQDYYQSAQGPLHGQNQSSVAIIGTLATSLTYMLAIFNGPLSSRFSVQTLMAVGGAISGLGLILTGFCSKTWQFAITQGIMYGVGASLLYLPPVVCAPPYFTRHRGIAMGVVFAGTGVGGLAMAPFTRYLISQHGWQWAVRILGLLVLVLGGISSRLVFVHPNFRPSNLGLVNLRIAKTPKFLLHISGTTLQSQGYLVPLFFMSAYGQTIGFSASQGATFIGINNIVNAMSKVVLGFWSDYIGRFNMLLLCCVMSMITVFTLWMVPSKDAYIAFVVLNGVFSGPIIALLPACLVELFGVQNYHSISGLMYFFRGVGNMLGSPIAGLFVQSGATKPAQYRDAILYTGSVLAANCAFFIILRGYLVRENKKLKF